MIDIRVGDALEEMRKMPDRHFQTIITSPPYFNLRDYKVDGQIGLEKTLEEYIERLVATFREARRVLRDDGTLWLNLGDSYSGTHQSGTNRLGSSPHSTRGGARKIDNEHFSLRTRNSPGFKPKDLMLIPARVAIALQADGWWVRSDIIWRKGNPMPESTQDRPSRCHEYIFLLTKSELYYYDAEAVKELSSGTANPRGKGHNPKESEPGLGIRSNSSFQEATRHELVTHRSVRTVWDGNEDEFLQFLRWKIENTPEAVDVWDINTTPYKGPHFATFPPELAKTCIQAGSAPFACEVCLAPWQRLMRHRSVDRTELPPSHPEFRPRRYDYGKSVDSQVPGQARKYRLTETLGWQRCLEHTEAPAHRSRILDPFGGAGTVGLEGERQGRDTTLIEINPETAQLALDRINSESSLLQPAEIVCG